MKSIASKYTPIQIEERWYNHWMNKNYFHSEPNEKEAYTIVIPPPNVTGVLHMGHMLNNTIQDVLIRRARMNGYNACWVPGTDHASIATEAKVVAKLKSEGKSKSDLTREEFLEEAWKWTHLHGGIILDQLKKLGASCDWERTKFTLDDDLYESVIQVFIDLYNKGLIYRGYRMINWDPEAQTTVSDEEVIYEEEQGFLYHIYYPISGSDEKLVVATTRPETLLGDTAICINPNDERYTHLHGKKAIVPIVNREVPIILDEYVDMEFGTGCLKVTPAHDQNDKTLGEKHNLEVIDILNDDGSLNSEGLHYEGKDRFVVRKEIAKELKTLELLKEKENYKNKVGKSERTGAVIEPKVSLQWFLKMEDLSKPALEAVENGEVELIPKKFLATYKHWMENVRDWNISRQLWWGHQIPAFYFGNSMNDFVVAKTKEEALPLAIEKSGNHNLKVEDLKQDEDVLDTWFSSWLWPISVFDGIRNPENEEINYYYPTQDLVTAPEILFFWVARMIIAGYEFKAKKPFSNVYLTGIVRDKLGRKMSKSLGNSPDPIELMNKYGADGVRIGMLLTSPAGNDLPFDEDLCLQGRNFCNKLWNAFRLVHGLETSEKPQTDFESYVDDWFENKFNETLVFVEDQFKKYRISDALMAIYKLIWDDFCSWYLELKKPAFEQKISLESKQNIIGHLEKLIKLLHPFAPFITEEIWQSIKERNEDEDLIVADWPKVESSEENVSEEFENLKEIITSVRKQKNELQISSKELIPVFTKENYSKNEEEVIKKLGNVSKLEVLSGEIPANYIAFRVGKQQFYLEAPENLDIESEKEKLLEELNYTQGFLKSVQKKLSNEKFVNNAPEKVVAMEKKKEADALEKIEVINARLESIENIG